MYFYLLYACSYCTWNSKSSFFPSLLLVSEWHENKHHMEHFACKRKEGSTKVVKLLKMLEWLIEKYFLPTSDERRYLLFAIFIQHFHTKKKKKKKKGREKRRFIKDSSYRLWCASGQVGKWKINFWCVHKEREFMVYTGVHINRCSLRRRWWECS